MRASPIVRVYYGPDEHQFFYCDAGLIDEGGRYAASAGEWRQQYPDTPPEYASLAALAFYEIVPGTN